MGFTRLSVITLLTILLIAGSALLLGAGLPGRAKVARADAGITIQSTMKADPFIKFQDGYELPSEYAKAIPSGLSTETVNIQSAMPWHEAQPVSLASADFNADGFPDLLSGYATTGGGMLALHSGNPQAYAPTDPQILQGIAQGVFPPSFVRKTLTYEVPEAPDFLVSGDFNRDGYADALMAARGGNALYFFAGNPQNGFAAAEPIAVNGAVTRMLAGDVNGDGLTDLLVAVDAAGGAALFIYQGVDDLFAIVPTARPLAATAQDLAIGNLDEDTLLDIAIIAGNQLYILHGQESHKGSESSTVDEKAGQLEAITLPFAIHAETLGDFIWDRESRMELAVVTADGTVRILKRGELDTRPLTAEEVQQHRQLIAEAGQSKAAATRLHSQSANRWEVAEQLATAIADGNSALPPVLLRTNISSQHSDDLVLMNPAGHHLQIFYKEDRQQQDGQLTAQSLEPFSPHNSVALESASEPVAALPMRVSVDGRPGLVVLRKDSPAPIVLAPQAAMTFTVTRADDIAPRGTCAVGDCTLREAVIAANANVGADTIMFSSGLNGSPIQLTRSGDDNTANLGDLDINDDLTITGNGAGNTLIQGSSNASFTGNMGDKLFGINQDGTHTTLNVSLSGLTVRFTRNDLVANGNFTQTGGAMDIFLTGTGAMPGPTTTVTNCTFDSNASLHSYGGGINIDSGSIPSTTNIFRGTVQFTGCTISNNKTLTTTVAGTDNSPHGGGLNLFADRHNVTFTNCSITGNQTSALITANGGGINMRHSNGGTITLTNTSVNNNTAGSDGGGILIASVGFETVIMTGGSISGNTAQGTGDSGAAGGLFNAANIGGNTSLSGVTISNNTATAGTSGEGGGVVDGANVPLSINNCTISGNSSDSGGGIATTNTGGTQTTTITNCTISGNTATTGGALFVRSGIMNASLNRIVSNTATTGSGIAQTGGTATVINNWWGCDGFPNATGCQTGSGTFDADPRIDLVVTATPSTLMFSQTSTIKADFSKNSDGTTINPTVMNGLLVTFNPGAAGSISPGSGIIASLMATSTYTAPATCPVPNMPMPSATVDNGTQPVTVTIAVPPTITTCQSNITANTDPGVCTATRSFTIVTDGCPAPAITCTIPGPVTIGSTTGYTLNSSFVFPKGVTTVTCTANNAVAPNAMCSFTVTVTDNQAPVFANCTNITTNTAPGVCQSAAVTYTTTLTDNCPGQTFSCVPASGSTFPKGVTTVTCNGMDASGNPAAPCTFTVTVNDNQAPSLTCPSNVVVSNDAGVCTAVVTYTTPTATDNCPPTSFAASCVPPTGSIFNKGVTTVTCTASDAATPTPNTTMCTFTVTVNDTEKPKSCITPPANMISWWSGDGNASDIQGVSPNNNNGTNNGATFAAGKVGQAFSFNGSGQWVSVSNSTSINLTGTAVTIDGWINPNSNATDAVYFGKSANASNDYVLLYQFSNISAIIKANGTETTINTGVSPTLGVWTHIALVYNGTDMRVYVNGVLTGGATARTGNLAGSAVPFGIGGRSGGLFFNGLVDEVELFNRALTATEVQSIFNAGSFGKCKPVVVNTAAGLCTATNTYTNPTFTDNCAPAGSIVCSPLANTTFAKGVTTVSCTITDGASPANTFTNSFEVRVVDNQAPTLGACPANISQNESAPGSGSAIVTYSNPTSSDNCPGQTVSCLPASGSSFPVGTTTVTCTATDTSGNTSTPCTFTVQINPLCMVNCPANITQNTDAGICTTVVTYAPPTTTGSCGPVTCSPASGSVFSKGVTTVTCTPTVSAPPCTFTITVVDNQAPTFPSGCPANQTVNTAAGQCQATITYTPPAVADNCTGATVNCVPASGTNFNKGVTTVTCTATDTAAVPNTATCSFTVTVVDNQAPTFPSGCPANQTVNTAAGMCQATATYTPPAVADNCPGATVSCTPASGGAFPKGVTIVTCTATDTATVPNTATCSFTVTVVDNQAPTFPSGCPVNQTVNTAVGQCQATATYTPPAVADNCTGATVSCVPASGTNFNKGVTTVTCTATDTAAIPNTATCTFTITVVDNQAPTFPSGCPANQTVNATSGQCQATITYTPPAVADNCTGATVACSPASGTLFPTGVTTVTCTATDTATIPNTATCSFTVTVVDNQAPTFPSGCPANQTVNTAAGQCQATVTYSNPAVADNCTGATVNCVPASGAIFPKGVTTVTCTASDTAAPTPNTATCTFTITVVDNQAPTFPSGCPANQTVNTAAGMCQATATYTPPAVADNCPGATVSCTPPSGGTFPKGTTTITCTATDTATVPNTATCSFTITVVDNQAPTFPKGCPANQTVSTGGSCANVSYANPTIADNCPGATVVCSPSSGTCFPVGTTTVTCTAMDTASSGPNTASCMFTITVIPCIITCPVNITRANDANQCGAVVTFAPNATMGCGLVTCSPASGAFFPKGVTTVTCNTTAGPGCSFTVTVNDTQPPTLVCPANQTVVTSLPGGTTVVVNYPPPTVTDNCPGVTTVCTPPSGSTFTLGVATVSCTATDTSSNTATCSFTVSVFNACLQDDSDPGMVLLWNTQTGAYRFCCSGTTYTGTGTVVKQGNVYKLTHNPADRRVSGMLDGGTNKGNASLQSPPGTVRCSLRDNNITNNSCQCQ